MSRTKRSPGRGMDAGSQSEVEHEVRREIEHRAYERYRARGGVHGKHLDDWLAGEEEVRSERAGTADADRAAGVDCSRPMRRPLE